MMMRFTILITLMTLLTGAVLAHEGDHEPEIVQIVAEDGLTLEGDFYAQETASPAVILLHMLGRDRATWEPMIAPLHDAGYSVLAVDMRGHGATGGERDWPLAQTDLSLWINWLREQESVREDAVSLVGASIGANVAIIGCGLDEACVTVVALSPGTDYRGVQPGPALVDSYEGRSALLAGGWDDSSVAADILAMAGASNTEIGIRIYETRAHGTNLLSGDDGERVMALVIAWLDEHTPGQTE